MGASARGVWLPMDLDARDHGDDEPMGTKDKFWIHVEGSHWLVKLCRVVDGETRGEDWAEWLVHRLAALIGVPTAVTEPATVRVDGDLRRGSASLDVREDPSLRLVHGNELLAEADAAYESGQRRGNARYTPTAVRVALGGFGPPPGLPHALRDAFDVWAGYLVLDAWVAGRDRHHENWAVVRWVRAAGYLVPSFDHGNALGFQEAERSVERLAADPLLLERWCRRGKSHHFAGRPDLVALALTALDLASDGARSHWLAALAAIDAEEIARTIAAVPQDLMSVGRSRFIAALLEVNRERLRRGHP